MTEWYYADAAHVRQGPVDAAELVRLRLAGRLDWNTLVWRDGMDDWRAMREFAGELARADDRAPLLSTSTGQSLDPAAAAAFTPAAAPTPAASAPASPYGPPAAAVASDTPVVLGGDVVYGGLLRR